MLDTNNYNIPVVSKEIYKLVQSIEQSHLKWIQSLQSSFQPLMSSCVKYQEIIAKQNKKFDETLNLIHRLNYSICRIDEYNQLILKNWEPILDVLGQLPSNVLKEVEESSLSLDAPVPNEKYSEEISTEQEQQFDCYFPTLKSWSRSEKMQLIGIIIALLSFLSQFIQNNEVNALENRVYRLEQNRDIQSCNDNQMSSTKFVATTKKHK